MLSAVEPLFMISSLVRLDQREGLVQPRESAMEERFDGSLLSGLSSGLAVGLLSDVVLLGGGEGGAVVVGGFGLTACLRLVETNVLLPAPFRDSL